MKNYIFAENGIIIGSSQCRILNPGVECIEVSDELYQAFNENPDCYALADGVPALDENRLREKIQRELFERFRSAIQDWMDGEAVKLGYDSILSACSYINTGNPKFDAEGEGFRQWRSAVWARGYALIDEVIAGQREVPDDPADVIALLPELSIVYPEAD